MTFDPAKAKEIAAGPRGYALCLAADFTHAKSVGGLASNAHADLDQVVRCLLVNLDGPAKQLLTRANEWLRIAIAEDEGADREGAEGTRAIRARDMAICEWLLRARHDSDNLLKYVEYKTSFLAGSGLAKDRVEVGFSLAGYVDAGAYERALDLFQNVPRANPPKTVGASSSEGQMAYVLCQHKLHKTYSDTDVRHAASSFLKRNVGKFLTDGRYADAAQWLKILCWNDTDRTATPKQIVMQCYDYLPGRSPPP